MFTQISTCYGLFGGGARQTDSLCNNCDGVACSRLQSVQLGGRHSVWQSEVLQRNPVLIHQQNPETLRSARTTSPGHMEAN